MVMRKPEGSCLCGAVSFVVDQSLDDISYCHCSMCRKVTGSAFAAYGSTAIKNFSFLQGQALIREYQVSDVLSKRFCSQCGSTLITCHLDEPDIYHISLGCIADNIALKPEYHQFIDSKANWYEPADRLPQYSEWADED